MFVPPRDANLIDLASNTLGALLGRHRAARRSCAPTARATRCRRCAIASSCRAARRRRPRAARAVAGRADQSRRFRCSRSRSTSSARPGCDRRRAGAAGHRGRSLIEAAEIGVPAPRRRALPRAAAARSPPHRRRGAAADRRRAAGQGRRGDARAQARGLGDVAQARACRSAWRRALLALLVAIFLPRPVQVARVRDRASRLAAPAGARRRTCPPRARRSRSSTGATGTCSTSTASRRPCCSLWPVAGRGVAVRARGTPALGRAGVRRRL